MKQLGTDYLDIWFLHMRDTSESVNDGCFEALAAAKQQGKTRFAGVSTHYLDRLGPVILKYPVNDVVLVSYNFAMPPVVEGPIDAIHKAGLGLIGMKAMAGGSKAEKVPIQEQAFPRMKRPGATGAALRWALKNQRLACFLVGILDMDQLEDNLGNVHQRYTGADGKILQARCREIRGIYCRMCGSCEGQCPKGLPVAEMLRYLMYAEGYGQFAEARGLYQRLPADVKAVRCRDCAACPVRCVNGVAVKDRLSLAQDWFA